MATVTSSIMLMSCNSNAHNYRYRESFVASFIEIDPIRYWFRYFLKCLCMYYEQLPRVTYFKMVQHCQQSIKNQLFAPGDLSQDPPTFTSYILGCSDCFSGVMIDVRGVDWIPGWMFYPDNQVQGYMKNFVVYIKGKVWRFAELADSFSNYYRGEMFLVNFCFTLLQNLKYVLLKEVFQEIWSLKVLRITAKDWESSILIFCEYHFPTLIFSTANQFLCTYFEFWVHVEQEFSLLYTDFLLVKVKLHSLFKIWWDSLTKKGQKINLKLKQLLWQFEKQAFNNEI